MQYQREVKQIHIISPPNDSLYSHDSEYLRYNCYNYRLSYNNIIVLMIGLRIRHNCQPICSVNVKWVTYNWPHHIFHHLTHHVYIYTLCVNVCARTTTMFNSSRCWNICLCLLIYFLFPIYFSQHKLDMFGIEANEKF